MSISPPSDIVLDVARAADPARYKEATARLGTAGPVEPFGPAMQAEAARAKAAPAAAQPASSMANSDSAEAKKTRGTAETYRKFEAMALATMLESTMKGASESFFGKGVAGETWRSLLVEQIADQLSKSGGIGIAAQLARSAAANLSAPSVPEGSAAQSLIVNQTERTVLRALDPEDPAA